MWRAIAIGLAACAGPSAPALDIDWDTVLAPVSPRVVGHNAVWARGGLGLWDDAQRAVRADVAALVDDLHPGVLRFPGGTRAMTYHFDETIGPIADRKPQCDTFTGMLDPTTWGMDEALGFAEAHGAEVTMVTPWHDGTPERAAAMVAYANADASSAVAIGVDANGRDWGTAGLWATRRVANGHPAPYRVRFVEVGNEQYVTLKPGTNVCGTDHPFTQAERVENGVYIPSTARDVAAQVSRTARLVKQVDPEILVGAPALTDLLGQTVDPATAISDVDAQAGSSDKWNPTLVAIAGDDFDFFVLHVYSYTSDPERVRLADDLRRDIESLRTIDTGHGFAVTEFGTLFDGGSQLSALDSADFARVAVEEGALANLRHILIEDRPSGLFATSAAILGADHALTPGYHAMRLVAGALQPVAVAWQSPDPEVVALATRDDASDSLGIVLIDRRLADTELALTLALPAGTWTGDVATLAASSVTGTDATLETTSVTTRDRIVVTLPANGLAVVRLAR
jgi:Alpha-L-arabinofuranosidase 1 domain